MFHFVLCRNLRLIIFETLENTIEDRGPVEEEERRKRMQVVERFQTAPSEEIAALCGSRGAEVNLTSDLRPETRWDRKQTAQHRKTI
ncbi:protein EFR3 homolog B-like isoform X2 [Girardinichthys multiradiatus]|uniref:protein EFR3 homolog B-like isoform X2 n=1 Tax=Girardinichthys multiradiatus TaxID=208333 RepID=UPI001FADFD36|nr:protein EFR3 homolog B-like isoform X2 [Girardinichthys multiradiatus]